MADRAGRRNWVVIAGGLDRQGAMDKANLALAHHLVRSGRSIDVVAHRIVPELRQLPGVRVHIVPCPVGSHLLGDWYLNCVGRRIAKFAERQVVPPIILSNGGNCTWPAVNWVHSVHHEWPTSDVGAPALFRIKNKVAKLAAKHFEKVAFSAATLLLANSERTKKDILRHFPLTAGRVVTVYLGSDPGVRETTPTSQRLAREDLGLPLNVPIVLFVGALSHDNNKGLDILIDAWLALLAKPTWNAQLLIVGGGRGVDSWKRRIAGDPRVSSRIKILGYRKDVQRLYVAADLLVAPSRYEAYGLAAHEAISTGLPVIVTKTAGIAERFPADLHPMLLGNSTDANELSLRLVEWYSGIATWRLKFRSFGQRLRSYTWDDMATHIVNLAESNELSLPPESS